MFHENSKSNWLVIIILALAVNAFLYIFMSTSKHDEFDFKAFSIGRVDGKLMLKLHRVINKSQTGEFYVSVYNDKTSCSASKPFDLIEAKRKDPFFTRFLSRLPEKCKKQLIPNHKYSVDVAYKINGVLYTRTTTVIFKPEDLK